MLPHQILSDMMHWMMWINLTCPFLNALCVQQYFAAGYEKKRLSEMRAVSITPTVLSVSLDQVEAIHSNEQSVVDRLRALSAVDDDVEGNISTLRVEQMGVR